MNSRTDRWHRPGYSRRRLLSVLAGAGVGGIAGCLGGGDNPSDDDGDADEDDTDPNDDGDGPSPTASDGDEEGTAEPSNDAGGGCPEWSSVSPYDVSDTDFAVVPSFPEGWTQFNESYSDAQVEVRSGYPESATADGTSYPDFVSISQVTGPTGKDMHEALIEQGLYEEDDPVVIDGEEFVVAREEGQLLVRYHLTVPGPDDTYHNTTVHAETARESCVEDVTTLGRAVVDALEANPETTL